tara:strand:- start:196 stop:1509 length:1314 start_codon:yes stop_codon:yes gene_type:complete
MTKSRNYNLLIIILTVLTFVFPYMKIKIVSIPIYFLDVFILFLYFFIKKENLKNEYWLKFLKAYFLFTIISFFYELLLYNNIESIYFYFRLTLNFLIFGLISSLVISRDNLNTLVKSIFICSIINSLFIIFFSNAETRFLVEFFYESEFFYPQKNKFVNDFSSIIFQRGQTLAGGANFSGHLILMGMSVLLYYLTKTYKEFKLFTWLNIPVSIFIICIFIYAIILSLSRSSILSLVLLLLFFIFYNSKSNFTKTFFIILTSTSIFIFSSSLFTNVDLSRLYRAVDLIEGSAEVGHSEQERIDAYTHPFKILAKNPLNFFFGKGIFTDKITGTSRYSKFHEGELKGRHGLLGSIVYDRGWISFMIFVLFIYSIARTAIFKKSKFSLLSKLLLIITISPLLLTHLFTDSIFGGYQLFFLFSTILLFSKNLKNKIDYYEN